ncbi:hypothetical protein Btru_033326 [Bulinus truncatus]|nr:hypothetical protein Btru_033326 [Bulinus truncatus]
MLRLVLLLLIDWVGNFQVTSGQASALSITPNDFTLMNISNTIYCLAKNNRLKFTDASDQCQKIGAELAFFNTNEEYFRVYNIFLNDVSLPRETWITFNATVVNRKYKFSWRKEAFKDSVWGSGEPNENCADVKQTCCARIRLSLSNGLADRHCSTLYYFLCRSIPKCPFGAVQCFSNCGQPVRVFDCLVGFKFNPIRVSCEDVDECAQNRSLCNQTCVNSVGSYLCECRAGYKVGNDNHSCVDIDECSLVNRSLCKQDCINNVGSFQCACRPGYALTIDSRTYECSFTHCSHNCTNTNGSYFCSCPSGYSLSSDNVTCMDVDECLYNAANCSNACTNTNGGYFCGCLPGYGPNDNKSCSDIDECINNGTHNCSSQHCNNTVGSYTCWCEHGYRLAADQVTCLDIDECHEKTSDCPQLCENVNGSYLCLCDTGYTSDDSGTCVDIDECVNATCHQKCINSDGSFYCACNSGYYLGPSNVTLCLDVNECNNIQTLCGQFCNNNDSSSQSSCSDIKDCQLCNLHCENTDGSYNCTCKTGYELDPSDNMTCLDVDECTFSPRACPGDCNNVPGSYHCTCQLGYYLSEDGQSCLKRKNQCPCSCSYANLAKIMGLKQLKYFLETLEKSLQVSEKNLASHRLLLTSQHDDRPSTKAIGCTGILIVAIAFCALVIPDVIALTCVIVDMIKARRNRQKKSRFILIADKSKAWFIQVNIIGSVSDPQNFHSKCDLRPTSQVTGYSGLVVVSFVFAIIILSDIVLLGRIMGQIYFFQDEQLH